MAVAAKVIITGKEKDTVLEVIYPSMVGEFLI